MDTKLLLSFNLFLAGNQVQGHGTAEEALRKLAEAVGPTGPRGSQRTHQSKAKP